MEVEEREVFSPVLTPAQQPAEEEVEEREVFSLVLTPAQVPAEEEVEEREVFSPERIRPFPKAAARTGQAKGRKRKKTEILTDTPVKEALEAEKAAALSKKTAALNKKTAALSKKTAALSKKTGVNKKKVGEAGQPKKKVVNKKGAPVRKSLFQSGNTPKQTMSRELEATKKKVAELQTQMDQLNEEAAEQVCVCASVDDRLG